MLYQHQPVKKEVAITATPTFQDIGTSVDNRGLGVTAGVIILFAVAVAIALAARWAIGRIKGAEAAAAAELKEKTAAKDAWNIEHLQRLQELEALALAKRAEDQALANLGFQKELRMAQDEVRGSASQYVVESRDEKFQSAKINNSIPVYIAKPYGLKNHTFFYKMKTYISTTILVLEIDEPLREAIFRDFLLFKFSTLGKNVEQFIDDGNIDRIPDELFFNKIHKIFDDSIEQSNQRAIDKGIPEVVVALFQVWYKPTVEQFRMFLADVCNSSWYVNNTQKTVAILDYLNVALHFTLINAQKTLYELNGELDNVEYRSRRSSKKFKSSHPKPKHPSSNHES